MEFMKYILSEILIIITENQFSVLLTKISKNKKLNNNESKIKTF